MQSDAGIQPTARIQLCSCFFLPARPVGDPDEWDTLMQLNTLSIMRLTRRLSQTLMDAAKSGPHEHTGMGQGAVLVNIGSVAGVETVSGMGAYCATKAALRAWSLCTFRVSNCL